MLHIVFGCVHCIRHVFSLTRPQLGNSGLKENFEFPTRNNDFVVAFMCVQLVNTMYPTWLERTMSPPELNSAPQFCNVNLWWKGELQHALKAKVYFTFYAYARDSVQCVWREFRHQNSMRVLYAHPRIFVTARILYAQVAQAHWSYFAVIMFSHMVATLSRAVVSQ